MGLRTLPRKMLAVLASTTLLAAAIPAFAQTLADGDKAAHAKDWANAARAYDLAYHDAGGADALEGLANAHYQLKHDGEAYAAYDEWNKKFGIAATKPKKALVEARLKELEGRTGLLLIDVPQPGASVTVDDKLLGTTPLTAPLRLSVGPHRVRIAKDGFVPIDQTPAVTTNVTATLTGKLEASTTKGRIAVKEATGKPIRITVDGVDMGDAPWAGEVEAGSHDVGGRAGAFVAAPEKITVEAGKTREVILTASSTSSPLKVTTSDGKGMIYFDGKLVGEGTFVGDVPAGPHQLRVTRDGYDPFEEQLELKDKESLARSITLKLSSKIETQEVAKEGRRLDGIYGGVSLMMTFLPMGMGHTMQSECNDSGRPEALTSCDGYGGSFGGGLTGFVGYSWDPVGVELYGGAQYDESSPTLNWAASSNDPGFGPDPARKEEFHVHRAGGFAIVRIRYTLQNERIRFSVAGGIGVSFRSMILTRDATQTSNGAQDAFVPDAQGYTSPILSLEPTVQYRLKPTLAISLGLSVLVERPGIFTSGSPQTAESNSHFLAVANQQGPAPGISTPAYTLASGTQLYIGPVIGVMFGP